MWNVQVHTTHPTEACPYVTLSPYFLLHGYNLHVRPFKKNLFPFSFCNAPIPVDLPRDERVSIDRQWLFWLLFHHDGKIQPSLVRVRGACPPPLTISTITSKVVVYPPAEKADTLLLFPFYPFLLCGFTNSIYLSDNKPFECRLTPDCIAYR